MIRMADSLETNAVTGFLSVSGTIPKSFIQAEKCLENLKKNYKSILSEFPTLRLKLITKDNIPYWYYATNDEIQLDKLVKLDNEPFEDEPPLPYDLSEKPLWRFNITQFKEKTKLKMTCCHCIIDGRAIFDLFDIFASVAIGKEYSERINSYRNQPALYEFGKKVWYTKEITDKKIENPFDKLSNLNNRINPKITVPSHFINPQWEVPYPPISKFCRKHGISPQSILMAIQNEAVRNFNKNIKEDFLIPIYIPIDNRKMKYSSEIFKKCLFFNHIGAIMPFLQKENNILENIKKSFKLLKEGLNETFTCDFNYYISNMRDLETGKMKFISNYPDALCFSFASHIGLVCEGFDDIQFKSNNPISENLYWACFYGYHNQETFYFMYSIPYNCPEDFLKSVKDVSMKYYNFIVNDIKE